MKRAVVLLSSGLDSTYNFLKAVQDFNVVRTVTFDYGQHSSEKEILNSKRLSELRQVPNSVVRLPFFSMISKSSLNTSSDDLPQGDEVSIDDIPQSQKTAKSVWVPNRNGVFLNIGAAFAEGLGAEYVIPGFNKEEAATFPDNSEDYMKRLNSSFQLSTGTGVEVHCYSHDKTKSEIVKEMVLLNPDWKLIWPCYKNLDKICGVCESCQRYLRALEVNGVSHYADKMD